MAHINNLSFLGNAQVALGILFSCVAHQLFYFTRTIYIFSLSLLVSFNGRVMCMWGHYGFRIVGVFLGSLSEVLNLTTNVL